MAYGGLINAFSSGMVDGARAGTLLDATFAEQDNRALEADAREVTGFVELLAASGNDFNKALSTPAGQQMAYKAIASNPAVREAFASNPGFEHVGMVQTLDGRYTFVGRGEDGGIKPLTSGGKAVTYDSQQLMALTAAAAGRLGVHNTAQGQADLDTVSQAGDIFDDLEKAGVAPAQELRGLAQQGQQFIEQGGIPRQKGGIPAIRAATKPVKAAEKEQVIPAAQKPAEKEHVIPALLKPAEKEQVIPASLKPAEKTPAAEEEQVIPAAQKPAEKEQVIPALLKPAEKKPAAEADLLKLGGKSFEDIRRLAVPTLSEQKADFAAARDERRAKQEAAYQKAFEEASIPRDIGAAARSTSDFIGRGIDGFRNYVTKPAASAVEAGVQKLGGAASEFARGFSGEKAPAAPAPQTQQQAPAKAPAKAPAQQQQAPASAAQKAVQKERVSYKVVNSPEKLEQLDSALSEQITAEPPKVRVQNDNRALERLSKLGQGKKPNSAQLHAAYRLAKSGLIPPQALAMFTQTGKLDNTAFDNAYKEHNIRQGYAELAQGDRRLSFDMFKEQRQEARSIRGQQVSMITAALKQQGLADAKAEKAAEELDKKGRGMLTQTVASQFRQMPRYKEANDSVIEDEAEAAVTYMLANPQYVGQMLGGRVVPTSMPDFVVLSEGLPAMVNQTVGEDGFWSSKRVLGHPFNLFKEAQKTLTGE